MTIYHKLADWRDLLLRLHRLYDELPLEHDQSWLAGRLGVHRNSVIRVMVEPGSGFVRAGATCWARVSRPTDEEVSRLPFERMPRK